MIARYTRWLHTKWPAGTVEKLPEVQPDGSTNVPGLFVVGDLTGIPLLKFAADSGARAVKTLASERSFENRETQDPGVVDLAIIGASVSGFAAALEAEQQGLSFKLFEASEPFSTLVNFPKGKPIFTYPTDMTPAGSLQFHEKSDVKEGLLEDLHEQTLDKGIEITRQRIERVKRSGKYFEVFPAKGDPIKAHRVIIGIGRSGNFRKLGVPGEQLDKVSNRLHDPKDYCGKNVLVVGGGDSALEAAIALGACGANVTLSYRKPEFSRPKPENIEKLEELARNPDADVQIEHPSSERVTTSAGGFTGKPASRGSVTLNLPSSVKEIRDSEVVLDSNGSDETIKNDAVFAMIGREPPLDFFRRSGVHVRGDFRWGAFLPAALFLLLCFWVYHWKAYSFDQFIPSALIVNTGGAANWASDPSTLLGTIAKSASGRSFWYTLAYSTAIVVFGIMRIRRRKTPYVKFQTLTLMTIQVLPLFVIPEILLPWMGANGVFDNGVGAWIAAQFFPHESWWRAYGLILAWPLFAWNWFTEQPLWGWLIVGAIQTFVLIPLIIRYWGKGAYCGWICSCGAMAETMGDTLRHKMPHGPKWNRLNMLGQGVLAFALLVLILRIISWADGSDGSTLDRAYTAVATGIPLINYKYFVDLMLAGAVGYGLYFFYSGRVWCRFACPLAALMHIYARFSRFRILADKKKCISCNVCTSVCHQGIDIMNFANKGLPMEDPECVRCSACVQMCPTGVLSFGQIDRKTGEVISTDPGWLAASRVQMAELTINGQKA